MDHKQLLTQITGLAFIMLLLVACGAPRGSQANYKKEIIGSWSGTHKIGPRSNGHLEVTFTEDGLLHFSFEGEKGSIFEIAPYKFVDEDTIEYTHSHGALPPSTITTDYLELSMPSEGHLIVEYRHLGIVWDLTRVSE